MPGAEASWPQFDYYKIHPERLKPVVATVGMEHMGGRQTIEIGPGGDNYVYSSERPEDGGVITSLIDVYNNNLWLVDAIARAATDNRWPRVDVKAGPIAPGVNGGFQGKVKSPMNKGREYQIPGVGLAGDWPGGWTQTYAQMDTEAGANGFDKDYFVQQVAGLTQLTGEFMLVKPLVIDLGWGMLRSALLNLKDTSFVAPQDAKAHRQALVNQYVTAFKRVVAGTLGQANAALDDIKAFISDRVVAEQRRVIGELVDGQRSKLG